MRVAFNKGKDRIINAIATENMLKYLPGTKARHTIKRPLQAEIYKPKTATDTLYEFTREVIPRIEESIEKRLLSSFMDNLGNKEEKKEVLEAYKIRKHQLSKLDDHTFVSNTLLKDPDEELYENESKVGIKPRIKIFTGEEAKDRVNAFASLDGKGLSYHTYDTIGKYTVFPKSHWKRMFPRESWGLFDVNDFKHSQSYGIMCTEEGLKLTYDLARRTLPKDRKINYEELITSGIDMKDVIKDEQMFVQIYQDFWIDLLDWIDERKSLAVRNVFESPSIFDGIVGILIRELRK